MWGRVCRCCCARTITRCCTTPARAIHRVSIWAKPRCVPSLHAIGITRSTCPDVSHGDNDHAGGAEAVSTRVSACASLCRRARIEAMCPMRQCVAGQSLALGRRAISASLQPQHAATSRQRQSAACLLVERARWPAVADRRHQRECRTGDGHCASATVPSPVLARAASRQQDLVERGLSARIAAVAGDRLGGLSQPLRPSRAGGLARYPRRPIPLFCHLPQRRGADRDFQPRMRRARGPRAPAATALLARAERPRRCHAPQVRWAATAIMRAHLSAVRRGIESVGNSHGWRLGDGAHPDLLRRLRWRSCWSGCWTLRRKSVLPPGLGDEVREWARSGQLDPAHIETLREQFAAG